MLKMKKVANFTFVFYFFVLVINCFSQSKLKDTYVLLTKEKEKYDFIISSLIEKPLTPTDTIRVKFTFSLLAENQTEELNENTFTFKMKYTRPNSITAINYLPDDIISKLAIKSNKFPPNYEIFCKEKIVKNMSSTFKLIESDLKLKKVGFFE